MSSSDGYEAATHRHARERATFAQARLEQAREDFDAESGKVIRFLRASLELAGEDYLSRRVLGKRRGRPRKSQTAQRKSDVEAKESSPVARKIESATVSTLSAARKIDKTAATGAPAADEVPAKIDRGVVRPDMEPRELAEPSNKAVTISSESATTSGNAYKEPGKIDEAPCKPCTEPFPDEQVYSFQPDTARTRRRRRRAVSSILGVSARLLSSGWMGRLVSEGRWRKNGGERA